MPKIQRVISFRPSSKLMDTIKAEADLRGLKISTYVAFLVERGLAESRVDALLEHHSINAKRLRHIAIIAARGIARTGIQMKTEEVKIADASAREAIDSDKLWEL